MKEFPDEVMNVAADAIRKAITSELVGYNKPLSVAVSSALEARSGQLQKLVNESVDGLLNAEAFRDSVRQAMTDKLGKLLISKMGGEVEKRLNDLRASPDTRAKITLAITKLMEDIA